MIKVTQQYPQSGVNFGAGWVGFVCHRDEFIAAGIDWFERWDTITRLPLGAASHTFTLVGAGLTIEAFEGGVFRGSIFSYLSDANTALLVRRPRCLSADLAHRIADRAQTHIGQPYNNALIAAHAAANTYAGHLINCITRGRFEDWLCLHADKPNTWICSKEVATDLQQPELLYPGSVLTRPPCAVKPVDLFEDEKIFEPGAIELVPPGHPLEDDDD